MQLRFTTLSLWNIQKNSAEVNETIDDFELLGLSSLSPQGMTSLKP